MTPTLSEARRDLQAQILDIAFPALFAYYGLLTVAHALFLEGSLRSLMMALAMGTSAIAATMTLARKQALVRRYADVGSALVAALVTANGAIHLVVSGEVWQSTNLLLTVLGASVLVTSTPLFALSLAAVAGCFAYAMLTLPADPMWPHFGFALFGASVLATIMFLVRRAAFRGRFEAERERDRADLTRQRRADEALAHESRYRIVVSLSPAAIVVHRDGIVLFANQAAGRLIGAGDESVLVDSRLYDLFPPEDEEQIAAWSESAMAGELGSDRLESRLRALRGDWPIVELATTGIEWEGEPAAILVATDVTDRKELSRVRDQARTQMNERVRHPIERALEALSKDDTVVAAGQLATALRNLDEATADEPG